MRGLVKVSEEWVGGRRGEVCEDVEDVKIRGRMCEGANHTADGWFFVFLEIIVDEAEDQ